YSQTLSEMGMAELISYSTLSRKPYLFRRFTGLTIDEFNLFDLFINLMRSGGKWVFQSSLLF
ncbi:MAG: hypothetical protein ACXQTM_00960, partial [Methanosarcinales archaeon]